VNDSAEATRMKPQVFKTRRDVERYFSGDTIECLICGRHFLLAWHTRRRLWPLITPFLVVGLWRRRRQCRRCPK